MAITTSQITITTMEGWYSGATPPLNPLIGDLWLDTVNNEIKKYDGTNWIKQADTQGPQGPKGDSIKSREAYWIKSSTKPDKPDSSSISNWTLGSEPPENALSGISASDKFWRAYKDTYSNEKSEYSEVELIGSYEVLNGLVQFRNGVSTTENIGGQDVTVIDGGKILTGSIEADKMSIKDLSALKAKIGGFNIGENSIYSGTKSSVNNTEKGIYFDSNGHLYFGDDKNFIRFYQSAEDDRYKLQVSADSLTFGSSESVEKAIDNLEIGGRNLVTNSVNLSDFSIESSTYTTRTITDDYCIVNRLVNANSSSNNYGIYKDIPVTAGEEYTVSCTVKEITGRMHLGLGYDASKWSGFGIWDLSVGRFTHTVTAPSSATFIRIYIAGNDGVNGGSVTVSNIKLEKGNKATDWTPAPEDVDAGIANAQTAADTAKSKAEAINSKGEQLVINGNAILGNNTNFTRWLYDGSVANGSGGSFTLSPGTGKTIVNDEFFGLDPLKDYRFEFDAISKDSTSKNYSMLVFYDIDKKEITSQYHMYISEVTELAADLKDGDTVVYLNDISSFKTNTGTATYKRGFIFWNYTNSFGYTYPPKTYSRNTFYNLWEDSGVNKVDNTITLKSPWSKGTVPAGTKLSQCSSGANYKYQPLGYSVVPSEWTHYSCVYSGTDYSGTNISSKFPPGTAYCKVGFLWNYNRSSTDQLWITNISVYEDYKTGIANAQKTADTAKTAANNAQSTADTAKANAAAAQKTADTAKSNAANAQKTADTAKSNAANAQTTADTAKSNAAAAQTAANTAQNTANSAQSTANKAQSSANTAQNTATEAAKTADNYISVDSTGIMVSKNNGATKETPSNATKNNVLITDTDVRIRNGQKTVASYGETSTIGNDEGNSIHIDDSGIDIMAEGQPLAKFGLSNATKYAPVIYDIINKNLTDGKCTGLSTYKINKNYANEGELKTHVTVKLIYHENDDGTLDNNAIVPLDEYHPNSYTLGIAGDHISITFEENAFQTEVKHFRPSYEGDFSDVDIALTYPAAYGLGMVTIGNRLNWPEYNDTGDFSLAIGTGNVADDFSMAIGVLSFAQAYSIACGNLCTAGANSFAFGYSNQAEQGNSFALGSLLHTDAPNQLVIGYKNKTTAEGITARFVVAGGSQYEENEEEPYNSAAITGDGDVRIKGDLYAHCNDDSGGGISFTKITSGTGTAKATAGRVSIKPKWWRCGNLVQLEFGVEATGAVNPGKNLATGTINGIPRPITTKGLRAVSYYGNNANVLFIASDGGFTVRNCGNDALGKGNDAIGIFTYITDGTML